MSLIENMFLYPVRLLMKMLWILILLLLVVLVVTLLSRYPYLLLGYITGFLIAPIILRKTGVYHVDVTDALSAIIFKHQILDQLEAILQTNLAELSQKHNHKEQKIHRKIQRLQEETLQLDKRYIELLDREPDRVDYYQPCSFLQGIKSKLRNIGGR